MARMISSISHLCNRVWIAFSRLFLLFSFISLMGCTSLSHFQTARTLAPGTGRMIVGMGYLVSSDTNRPTGVKAMKTSLGELPLMDIAFRTGLKKYWDLGAKLSLPGTLSAEGKFQIWDHPIFAASIGFGLNYVIIASSSVGDGIRSHFLDLNFPITVGADLTKNIGLYIGPKLIYRKDIFSSSPVATLLGSTLGIKLGDKKGMFLEVCHLWELSNQANAIQLNLGFFLGTASSIPDYNRKSTPPPPKEKTSVTTQGDVIQFFHHTDTLTFTHPAFGNWRATDRICVKHEEKIIACGTIIRVEVPHAIAKLNFVKEPPPKGALVIIDE